MATYKTFEELDIWQDARKLANLIYDLTQEGAFAKDSGLRDQIRRAAVSVMSNIAEGFESRTTRMFIDYLGRAKGSAGEVRAQIYLALDRNYVSQNSFEITRELATSISKQIYRFSEYLTNAPFDSRVKEAEALYLSTNQPPNSGLTDISDAEL